MFISYNYGMINATTSQLKDSGVITDENQRTPERTGTSFVGVIPEGATFSERMKITNDFYASLEERRHVCEVNWLKGCLERWISRDASGAMMSPSDVQAYIESVSKSRKDPTPPPSPKKAGASKREVEIKLPLSEAAKRLQMDMLSPIANALLVGRKRAGGRLSLLAQTSATDDDNFPKHGGM